MATAVEQAAAHEDEHLFAESTASQKPEPPTKLTLEQANKLAAGRPFELIQVWFVDPYRKGVLVVTPDDQHWVKDTLTCPELLPGFAVKVQNIFTWPAMPAGTGE
ncbi:MAG: hypothetical protein ONB44_03280 [candidate division KSB1 bacterium]|nr:hypothetical protein [candidate division KSB1 bacterium]MDZ7301150.1 hypothetical protein [candidate division KSB1 bacterium]MDZ7311966.1 hypothetical protein [candidate division KSB1 bacterium]